MFEKFEIPDELMPEDPRFGVGPSLIPVTHLESLVKTGTKLLGTSHRQMEVRNLVKELQDGLRHYFKLPDNYEVIIGNGGATSLFDMIGMGLVEKASVHYTMGEFSTKWFKAHSKIPWIHATQKSTEFGEGIKVEPCEAHDMICCTLNETSTGVMIDALPDVTKSDTLLVVDATSGAGQIKMEMEKVDLYFFSPQKVFAGEGGMFFAFMSPKAIKRAQRLKDRTHYIPEFMLWEHAIENSIKNQTYNTPSISNLFLINEQLKTMNQLGEDKVCDLAKEKADLIYSWAEKMHYLNPFVRDKHFRSTSVATIDVDDEYPIGELLDRLREKNIIYDIEGYRKIGRNQLRISLFHNIKIEDLKKLTEIISLAIESQLE